MPNHVDGYRQWPFLTAEEFELACAFFDQKYIKTKLGPTRQTFKIHSRRALTTGVPYIEIIRLLGLPEDDDELALAFQSLGGVSKSNADLEMRMAEDADEVRGHVFRTESQIVSGCFLYFPSSSLAELLLGSSSLKSDISSSTGQ